MSDDEMAAAISDNYPQFAGKPDAAAAPPAPRVLGGLPVKDPNAPAPEPTERPSVLAGMPVKDPADDSSAPAPAALDGATNMDPAQNQFAVNRMSRADYAREFRTLNPRAPQAAVDAALAQYDQQKAAQLKAQDAKRQAGPMKPVPTADEFFNTRLNQRLQARNQGVVQVQPAHEQQDFSSTTTQHAADVGDESAASAAGSYLGRSTTAGLYDLAGAGAKLLDAINPFTLSEGDAAILFKNDPAKLKQMQDESIAMGLSRFAKSMQADSGEQMEKVSARGKRDYGQLEYATTDASKSALLSPVKVVGDAIRSLPSSLAMGATAYFTRGASLRAEEAALAAGLGADAARAAGVQAAMKFMGNAGAASEGAIGYAQQALSSADDASKIPMAKLQKTPQFQSLLRQGFTPETARAKIIADIGEHAGQIGGLVDAVTNKFGGAILGKIISEGGPVMKRVLSGAADESATEFVQSAGEQLGQNYANQLNADPDTPLWQGVGEAAVAGAAVGGLMGGVTAGVAGHHGHVDEGQLEQTLADAKEAEATRQSALSAWRNNGLSPAVSPNGSSRVEPTLGQAGAAAAAPSGRAEPTLGDIAGASSVDEAIAAAQRMADAPAAPVNLPHPSTLPSAAEIDALEEQAGLLAEAGKPAAEMPSADLPAAPQAAPAAGLTGKESDDTSDWHPFPAEMRSLGVPRAQMPQIRAEHRGAMVNFLNARGISHEAVEVPAESLHPTQREFSVSKVDKALEHEGGNRSILISSDNYVLDGHHQWMAAAIKNEPVQAIRLNAPIKQLVQTVHQFPSSTVDTSSAPQGGLGQGARLGVTALDDGRPLSPYEAGQERIRRQEEAVRKAIEKQAQHRAGQAPQQPGSSIPTAAERAPAAPMSPPKPTAGQRMRERIRRENPFLAFLATHGLHIDERSDTGGQKGRAGGVIVPGFGGSLYRKSGARLDELAQLAHEAGFLSDDDINNPSDTGGTRKLADLIERAVHSREVIEQPGLIEAHAPSSDQQLIDEAQRLGIEHTGMDADQLYDAVWAAHAAEEGRRETSGAEHADEQDVVDHYESQITPQELADADIPIDLNDPRLALGHELTEEEINAIFGIQKAESPRADRGETEGHAAADPREGAAPAGQPGQDGEGDLLTSYTPAEVLAREDATMAREKAAQAERDKLEAQRKKAQDEKETRARADASVDDFQLGQDAHAQLSGQRGMFDEPAPAPAAKPKQAEMERQEFDAKSGVGKISAVKQRYDDKFGVSWASTNIATANTMEEAAAIARAVAKSGADNIKEMRRVGQEEQRRQHGIGRDGMRDSDRAAKDLDSAVEEFTIQTKEELASDEPITAAEAREGALAWAKDAGLNEGEFLRTLYRKWTRNKNNLELQELADGLLEGAAPEGEAKQGPATPVHKYDPERARPLLLIPCSDAKLEGTYKAIDLYKGVLYDVYRKWKPTENRPDVYILSAKHGIIHANTLLENYEQPMTPERLDELMAKPFDLAPFAGKNFNEVYIAGSAQYRQLGQRYVDELRQAGHVGPDAPVDHPPKGAGIGDQRGHFADYLRKVDMRGPANAAELSDQLDAEHAARETKAPETATDEAESASKAPEGATDDTGADIPADFYSTVTAQYRTLGSGELSDMPAHEALAKTREDIQQLEDMLKCMAG